MANAWLIRYGEIALKGENRPYFERLLINNMKDCLRKNKITYKEILRFRGRIIVLSEEDCSILKDVFGITSISPASRIGTNNIEETALAYYTKGSFKVSAQRVTKDGPESSQDINIRVGAYIVKKTGAKVNLNNPDIDIGIEIIKGEAYVFNKRIKAVGGLPLGCEGKVAVLLENEDSVKAAYLMMRRGCRITLVEKKKIDYEGLKKYAYGSEIRVVNKIPDDVKAVVTSENISNIKKRDYEQIVIRPLI